MSHELSRTRRGDFAFFEIGSVITAWHRGGIPIPDPDVELAVALRTIEADYTVEKHPTFRVVVAAGGGDERVVQSDKAFVTVRTDTGTELGSVGPDYTPLQNVEAFAALEPLLDSGVVRLDCGGVLRDGADAWVLGQFNLDRFGPVVREVFADEVTPYCLFTNNHSGRRNATVALTPVRVVCANTLAAAESYMDSETGQISSRHVKVRHTGDAQLRMAEAAETLFKGIIERYEVIARHYRLMKQTILTKPEFIRLVIDTAVPDPRKHKRFNPEARMAAAVVERYERKRERLTWLWENGKGHAGDHSAWEAYNGVVEAVDHDEDLFPVKSGVYRTQSLLDGVLRDIKQRPLDALLAHAEQRAGGGKRAATVGR